MIRTYPLWGIRSRPPVRWGRRSWRRCPWCPWASRGRPRCWSPGPCVRGPWWSGSSGWWRTRSWRPLAAACRTCSPRRPPPPPPLSTAQDTQGVRDGGEENHWLGEEQVYKGKNCQNLGQLEKCKLKIHSLYKSSLKKSIWETRVGGYLNFMKSRSENLALFQ